MQIADARKGRYQGVLSESGGTDQNGPSRDLRNCFRRPTLTKAQESETRLLTLFDLVPWPRILRL